MRVLLTCPSFAFLSARVSVLSFSTLNNLHTKVSERGEVGGHEESERESERDSYTRFLLLSFSKVTLFLDTENALFLQLEGHFVSKSLYLCVCATERCSVLSI